MLKNKLGQILILDTGINYDKIIMDSFIPSTKNILGALITHSHNDHSKSMDELENSGIDIYSYKTLKPLEKFTIDNFEIMTIPLVHNVYNIGFIIKDKLSGKKMVYATDTSAIPPIKNIDYWLMECNHTKARMEYQIQKGSESSIHLGNAMTNHFSLEKMIKYFQNEQVTKPEHLIACHLSNSTATKKDILDRMQKYTNKLNIAKKGELYKL